MASVNKVPDQSYVEAVLASMDRYPFATQSLILLAALGAFCYYLHKRKQ